MISAMMVATLSVIAKDSIVQDYPQYSMKGIYITEDSSTGTPPSTTTSDKQPAITLSQYKDEIRRLFGTDPNDHANTPILERTGLLPPAQAKFVKFFIQTVISDRDVFKLFKDVDRSDKYYSSKMKEKIGDLISKYADNLPPGSDEFSEIFSAFKSLHNFEKTQSALNEATDKLAQIKAKYVDRLNKDPDLKAKADKLFKKVTDNKEKQSKVIDKRKEVLYGQGKPPVSIWNIDPLLREGFLKASEEKIDVFNKKKAGVLSLLEKYRKLFEHPPDPKPKPPQPIINPLNKIELTDTDKLYQKIMIYIVSGFLLIISGLMGTILINNKKLKAKKLSKKLKWIIGSAGTMTSLTALVLVIINIIGIGA